MDLNFLVALVATLDEMAVNAFLMAPGSTLVAIDRTNYLQLMALRDDLAARDRRTHKPHALAAEGA